MRKAIVVFLSSQGRIFTSKGTVGKARFIEMRNLLRVSRGTGRGESPRKPEDTGFFIHKRECLD